LTAPQGTRTRGEVETDEKFWKFGEQENQLSPSMLLPSSPGLRLAEFDAEVIVEL